MKFRELPQQVQDDLLAWYNSKPSWHDKQRLAKLYAEGRFKAWDCPGCGDRCYFGRPESWNLFQGVNQVDHTSYPGDTEKFTEEYLRQLCDTCRCHGEPCRHCKER